MSNRNLFMKSPFPHFVIVCNGGALSDFGNWGLGQLLLILKMQFFGTWNNDWLPKDVHVLILTTQKCVTYMADVIKAVNLEIGRLF